uniref:Uncharacterized protein n=1 Tax=Magallana gigas TaxID=29159 RepID=K1PJV4_MAGGI
MEIDEKVPKVGRGFKLIPKPQSACSDEQEVQFETVIFANPSSEVNSLDEHSSRKLQNKMKRKRPYCNGVKESDNIRREFLDGEKEKNRSLEVYRKKKIALYEKMVQQQSEMLELQKRSGGLRDPGLGDSNPASRLFDWQF